MKQNQLEQISYTNLGVIETMKGNPMETTKFRVSISLDELNWIVDNCKETKPELYNRLLLIKIKADGGLTKPAFVTKPEIPGVRKGASLKEKYQFVVDQKNKGISLDQIPEELRLAYDEYRYLNDLMGPEEMEAYEKQALGDM